MTDRNRTLVKPTTTAKSIVPASLVFKGGTVEGTGGLLIDGKLTGTRILSTDKSLIHISAQAVLTECVLEGEDVLIEGTFEGTAKVRGNCEIGPSASAVGTIEVAGDLFKSRFADTVDLKLIQMHPVAEEVAEEAGAHLRLAGT